MSFSPSQCKLANKLGRLGTWLCVLLLVVLSLVPGDDRPHTGLAGPIEHFIAYAGTGIIAALAYRRPVMTMVGLLLLSFSLELAQNFVPGRGPTVSDGLISTLGGGVGSLLGRFLNVARARSSVLHRGKWRDFFQ